MSKPKHVSITMAVPQKHRAPVPLPAERSIVVLRSEELYKALLAGKNAAEGTFSASSSLLESIQPPGM